MKNNFIPLLVTEYGLVDTFAHHEKTHSQTGHDSMSARTRIPFGFASPKPNTLLPMRGQQVVTHHGETSPRVSRVPDQGF